MNIDKNSVGYLREFKVTCIVLNNNGHKDWQDVTTFISTWDMMYVILNKIFNGYALESIKSFKVEYFDDKTMDWIEVEKMGNIHRVQTVFKTDKEG